MSLFAQSVDMKNVKPIWKSQSQRVVVGRALSCYRVVVDGQSECESRSAMEIEAFLQSLPIDIIGGDDLYNFSEEHLGHEVSVSTQF